MYLVSFLPKISLKKRHNLCFSRPLSLLTVYFHFLSVSRSIVFFGLWRRCYFSYFFWKRSDFFVRNLSVAIYWYWKMNRLAVVWKLAYKWTDERFHLVTMSNWWFRIFVFVFWLHYNFSIAVFYLFLFTITPSFIPSFTLFPFIRVGHNYFCFFMFVVISSIFFSFRAWMVYTHKKR